MACVAGSAGGQAFASPEAGNSDQKPPRPHGPGGFWRVWRPAVPPPPAPRSRERRRRAETRTAPVDRAGGTALRCLAFSREDFPRARGGRRRPPRRRGRRLSGAPMAHFCNHAGACGRTMPAEQAIRDARLNTPAERRKRFRLDRTSLLPHAGNRTTAAVFACVPVRSGPEVIPPDQLFLPHAVPS